MGCDELCHLHQEVPRRCVAFEGTNTGRRFYLCPIENQVMNCGFHSWVDKEWPNTLKNALSKLWSMYYETNSVYIDDKYQSSKMLKELANEKEKIERKHACLLEEGHKWLDDIEKKAQMHNLDMMNREKLEDEQREQHMEDLKNEVEVLKSAKEEMKNMLKSQAEVFKVKQKRLVDERDVLLEEKKWEADRDALMEKRKKWEDERVATKEENKKLEYTLFDMFKDSHVYKDKMKKIKDICDEWSFRELVVVAETYYYNNVFC